MGQGWEHLQRYRVAQRVLYREAGQGRARTHLHSRPSKRIGTSSSLWMTTHCHSTSRSMVPCSRLALPSLTLPMNLPPTEAKIRDVAQTLARLNSSTSPSPTRISRQSSTALETAERKVDGAQTELWRVQERAANIGRRLLEHRAGVLGIALAEAERAQGGGRTITPDTDWTLIPPSSTSSLAHKFDGAHFFAGHEGSVVPGKLPRGGSSGASREELEELEARLAAAEARIQERESTVMHLPLVLTRHHTL